MSNRHLLPSNSSHLGVEMKDFELTLQDFLWCLVWSKQHKRPRNVKLDLPPLLLSKFHTDLLLRAICQPPRCQGVEINAASVE